MADPRDRDIMIRTILGEAAGEDAYGQAAVGHVILNRMRDPRWGGSISDVALAPQQFSAWNKGAGGNNPSKWDPNSEAYQRTGRVVDALLGGQIEDMTGGATHYYSPAGMQLLVNEGSQSNLIPRWLQEETDRRGGENFTLGGHIFTGKANIPALSASTQGEAPAMQPWQLPITMSGIDGGPGEDMRRDSWFNPQTGQWQEGGRPAVTGIPENSPVFKPDWYFPAGSAGGGSSSVSTQGTPAPLGPQSVSEAPTPGLFEKGWLTPKRSDMLLAIGSGLLSGEDWASGIAGASNNLLALNQSNREQDLQQQRIDQLGQETTQPTRKIPLGQVQMPDGSIRLDLLQDPVTGQITDSRGQVVDIMGAERINNADAFGSRGQMSSKQAQEEQSWLTNTTSSLTAFDRTIHTVENMKYGVEGFAQTLSAWAQTMAGLGLSQEQIAKKVAEGDLEGLVGMSREQVVGPGVMTEQDAARIVAYLGGDIKSILMNPDAAYERLQIARTNMLKEYDQRYRQYGAHLEKYPDLPYLPVNPYSPWTPPEEDMGVLDESNAGTETPDNGGKFNPDDINKILEGYGI